MSERANQQEQLAPISQKLRQRMRDQLDTSKKAMKELSVEELETVVGGYIPTNPYSKSSMKKGTLNGTPTFGSDIGGGRILGVNFWGP
jgi:bacteriocin-like protein